MIGPTEARAITIHVSETVYARLIAKAREAGKTPALYAKLLFEAAWAARCGKAEGDPILVDCVAKSLARRAPAKAPRTAVAEPIRTEQPAPCDCPPGWSASQWTFARLVCRDEGASIGEVMEALAPAYQDRRSISVLVSKVRPKLRSEGIEIETVDVWGWRVESHTRAAADALIGRSA